MDLDPNVLKRAYLQWPCRNNEGKIHRHRRKVQELAGRDRSRSKLSTLLQTLPYAWCRQPLSNAIFALISLVPVSCGKPYWSIHQLSRADDQCYETRSFVLERSDVMTRPLRAVKTIKDEKFGRVGSPCGDGGDFDRQLSDCVTLARSRPKLRVRSVTAHYRALLR